MLANQKITSRDNTRLKYVRRVRDGKDRKTVFVEGVRLCEEALRSNMSVRHCFVSRKALKNDRIKVVAAAVKASGVNIDEVSDALFRSIADTDSPQGIVIVSDRPPTGQNEFEEQIHLSTENIPVIIYLEEANNPANLGAIVRTVEAAGAAGAIISKQSADPFSPKALRSSMGSAFRLPIWTGADFDRVIDWACERKMVLTAADIDGDKTYSQTDWKIPRLLVLGSEAHGLSDAAKEKIEDLIKIPINSNVESLNLAVSAGIILFEAKRQMSS